MVQKLFFLARVLLAQPALAADPLPSWNNGAAFGNSDGDRQMLEYTKADSGARQAMLVLHDDAACEYAYGPAQGLPESKIGAFTQQLHVEAEKSGWIVISMKKDWRRVFAFDKE